AGPRTALSPQTQRLSLKKMRTMLERGQDARLRRHGRITGNQPRLELINVVPRLEAIAQHESPAQPTHTDLEGRIAPVVVALDDRNLDAEQTPLAGLTVEKTHKHVVDSW